MIMQSMTKLMGAVVLALLAVHLDLVASNPTTHNKTEATTPKKEATTKAPHHEETTKHVEKTTQTATTSKPTEAPTEAPTTPKSHYISHFHNKYCNFTACEQPNCLCLQDLPPGGLIPEQIPQFVLITFDGAVTVTNFPYYDMLFKYKNPNGCPIHATYFVSHVDSNYKLVHELHRHGNEIGVHSISKAKNNYQDYWKQLDYEGWRAEMGGQRRILSKYADIPIDQIRGARAPNLQTAGNITFTALVEEKFEYDCSNPSRKGINTPFFPYTLDYGFQRNDDCQVQPCLKEGQDYPGFWDIPMNDLNVKYTIGNDTFYRECASASACILFNNDGSVNYHPTADQIFELFDYNFDRFYKGNKAPFPLFLSEEWMHEENKREGLFKFIEKVSALKDVYFVTIEEVIEWMRKSDNVQDYENRTKQCKAIEQTKCGLPDGTKIEPTTQFKRQCDYKNIGELNGLTKRMVICDDVTCPANYPWTNRES